MEPENMSEGEPATTVGCCVQRKRVGPEVRREAMK